jgi:hypothetical protein
MNNNTNQLNILNNPNLTQATYLRSGISATIANLRAVEARGQQAGRSTREQASARGRLHTNSNRVHRNLTQHLALLATQHASLCYDFTEQDLFHNNLPVHQNPTAQRAITGCTLALEVLDFHHPDHLNPSSADQPVQDIIALWYSPAFNCTVTEFHLAVWRLALNRYVTIHVVNIQNARAEHNPNGAG